MLQNDNAWWIDSGSTRHVCNDKNMFSNYVEANAGNCMYMGNSTAAVKGKGTINLEFTSGKILTLTDVYHVPEIRKNLVSVSLLNMHGFKLVFDGDKFILSKGGVFVGKGYVYEGMYKLRSNEISINSAYIVDSLSLWHSRLDHVNTRKMRNMINHDLISKCANNMIDKCDICAHTKITRNSFSKNIERSSLILHLIHSDVYDFHKTPTRGGKKYFVTFIDDYSRFCYVYLLHSIVNMKFLISLKYIRQKLKFFVMLALNNLGLIEEENFTFPLFVNR